MPITRNATQTFTLRSLLVDMAVPRATAAFTVSIDGTPTGEIQVTAEGADVLTLLGANPDATKTRGADMTDAVYAYAISSGALNGVIS